MHLGMYLELQKKLQLFRVNTVGCYLLQLKNLQNL